MCNTKRTVCPVRKMNGARLGRRKVAGRGRGCFGRYRNLAMTASDRFLVIARSSLMRTTRQSRFSRSRLVSNTTTVVTLVSEAVEDCLSPSKVFGRGTEG